MPDGLGILQIPVRPRANPRVEVPLRVGSRRSRGRISGVTFGRLLAAADIERQLWSQHMKIFQRFIAGVLTLGFVGISSASPCTGVPHSNGQDIRVTGVLQSEIHWGPPNFGETPKTDSKFAAWVLHVDSPFTVVKDEGDGSEGEATVSEIQLELSNTFSDEQIAALVKKHISVEGSLWMAQTPGDVKDFNISVSRAAISGPKEGLSCISASDQERG